ncbi:MAG: DNA-binding transcriptional repressor MarR [Thermoleophilia bacterium]|jgi:DNA-binding MarR family transcriptional regulator|nr:DNA-binding transcriptional repressor MarR [Thermoleophilia bacterium]
MVQPIHPSPDACERLLRALPAVSAFRRSALRAVPEEARGWISALSVIDRHDGIRLVRVAEILHVDLSVASRQVSQLEALGLVERESDPADRRASILRASDAGRDRVVELRTAYAESMSGDLAGWGDDDVTAFADLLMRFGASLESAEQRDRIGAST